MKDIAILLLSLLLLAGSSEVGQGAPAALPEELGPIPAELIWEGKTYTVSDQQLPLREVGTRLGQASFLRGTRMVYEIRGTSASEQLAVKQMGKYYLLATLQK